MSACEQVLVVDRALRGIDLAEFLEREVPGVRRASLRAMVRQGQVRVNGEVVLSGRRLKMGDVVQVAGGLAKLGPAQEARPLAPSLPVLFESSTALVVAKPSGMPSVPDRNGRDSGVHGLLADLRPDGDLRIVHRLDRDTSGCLVLAKGLEAARHFDAAFRAGGVCKRYRALVHGVPREPEFEIDAWLGPDPRRPGKVLAAGRRRRGFREAHTAVRLAQEFCQYALLELRPTTGRGHQLRVHLASAGHPIVGDIDYGGEPLLLSRIKRGYKPRLGFAERPLVAHFFLHAEAVSFVDVDGADVAVTASMPEDLATALRKLERFSQPG